MGGLGILGTMEMARNAMQTARQGAEIAGNNLANASNPIYARQRVKIASAVAIIMLTLLVVPILFFHHFQSRELAE